MSNQESKFINYKITPQELADKLSHIIESEKTASNSPPVEINWRDFLDIIGKPHYYKPIENADKNRIKLSVSRIKTLCPELYELVIKPAYDSVERKVSHYTKEELPTSFILDAEYGNAEYLSREKTIILGLPLLRCSNSIEEVTAVIAHELGHLHQFSRQYRNNFMSIIRNEMEKPFPPSSIVKKVAMEYDADRYTNPLNQIEFFLSHMQNNKDNIATYDDDTLDDNYTHPSYRKRIKALLEDMLGNDVFGFNGKWVRKFNEPDEDNKLYGFKANSIQESPRMIREKLLKKIPHNKIHPDKFGYKKLPLTESGEIIANWDNLKDLIEKKSEELICQLDDAVYSGFNRKRSDWWLDIVKDEVAKFREEHKAEFLDFDKLHSVKLADQMQRNSLGKQRGG